MRHANQIVLALAGALILTGSSMAAQPGAAPAEIQSALASDHSAAIMAHRAWWTAFIIADTKHLEAHTAPAFSLALSGGQTWDRAAMLAEAVTHTEGENVEISWSEESVRFPATSLAIVTGRNDPGIGNAHRYPGGHCGRVSR